MTSIQISHTSSRPFALCTFYPPSSASRSAGRKPLLQIYLHHRPITLPLLTSHLSPPPLPLPAFNSIPHGSGQPSITSHFNLTSHRSIPSQAIAANAEHTFRPTNPLTAQIHHQATSHLVLVPMVPFQPVSMLHVRLSKV